MLELPEKAELAIVCVPSETVKDVVEECGKAGIKSMIIITAGFSELGEKGRQLLIGIDEIRKKYGIRVIGPNCLGIINPKLRLNATFAKSSIAEGKIVFISQSGALGTAVLDWAASKGMGMNCFVSIGSMMDLDFSDLIDYFSDDPNTSSIMLYIESLANATKFIDSASRFARKKPIFAVKSGREQEGAKAAASHTGALAAEDVLYDALFKRAGIVRLDETCEFLECFEALALQPLPAGNRLLIITNAGGPGVMATDYLIRKGGKLSQLSSETFSSLNSCLPPFWSRSNPIDLLGDAEQDRYAKALDLALKEQNADGIVVILTPQAMTRPVETARELIARSKSSKKPIFAAWMGEGMVEEARKLLIKGGIPVYPSPEQAINSFLMLYESTVEKQKVNEVQQDISMAGPDVGKIRVLLKAMAKSGKSIVSEAESKLVLEHYGIKTTLPRLAKTPQEAADIAKEIGFPVAMKIQSEDISHKSDANSVMLNVSSPEEALAKFNEIMKNARAYKKDARLEGVSIQKMVTEQGYEVILGSKRDSLFGPVVLFGLGGIAVEAVKDTNLEFAPLNRTFARRLIEGTKIGNILKTGLRNIPPANLAHLEEILVRFSRLVAELPEIKEIDINPLLLYNSHAIVLDARIILNND